MQQPPSAALGQSRNLAFSRTAGRSLKIYFLSESALPIVLYFILIIFNYFLLILNLIIYNCLAIHKIIFLVKGFFQAKIKVSTQKCRCSFTIPFLKKT